MLEQNQKLNNLFNSSAFRKRILAVNVDEAHCIYQWGDEFRKSYNRLSHLHARLPQHVPTFACSATLTPAMYLNITERLGFRSDPVVIRLSNNRPNIFLNIREMKHPTSSYRDLKPLVPPSAKSIYLERWYILTSETSICIWVTWLRNNTLSYLDRERLKTPENISDHTSISNTMANIHRLPTSNPIRARNTKRERFTILSVGQPLLYVQQRRQVW